MKMKELSKVSIRRSIGTYWESMNREVMIENFEGKRRGKRVAEIQSGSSSSYILKMQRSSSLEIISYVIMIGKKWNLK